MPAKLDADGHYPGCYPGGSGCRATRCAEGRAMARYFKYLKDTAEAEKKRLAKGYLNDDD
jgi:hypothetical protein